MKNNLYLEKGEVVKVKSKKIVIIFSCLLIVILIGGFLTIKHVKNLKDEENITYEYTPQEEISEEQARQTIVSLYFQSKETKELVPEARLIDIKEIINDPCDKLVQLLIDGPKNEKEEKIIPENTKLNKSYMDDDCVVIDFSNELLNFNKTEEKAKENLINSLVNTLTQLTEVNNVKILIDGNENEEFNEIYSLNK